MLWLLAEHHPANVDSDGRRALVGCAAEMARSVLPEFEKAYPNDLRPRMCLDVCDLYSNGVATRDDLYATSLHAHAAVRAATNDSANAPVYAAVRAAQYAATHPDIVAAYVASPFPSTSEGLADAANTVRRWFPVAPSAEEGEE
tara:strand:+ start:221 stop:652 length:432 start_codon:yes stop_codon:yes gene_type:complete